MKILADYHVHSDFSGDSQTPMEQMVEQGIHLGLERICFTDHMDYDFPKEYLHEVSGFEFDVEAYFNKITALQQRYKDKIKILAGIELGVKQGITSRLTQVVKQYPFDFVIASSHLVDNHDPYYPAYWNTINQDYAYGIRRYFETIAENVSAFSDFDVYGHLDYITRYIPDPNFKYNPEDYLESIDLALLTIIKHNKGIEINTAGLKYGLPYSHPTPFILNRYFELGGSYITIGSDAHKPEHLAYDFSVACKHLQNMGIRNYCVFEKRIPKTISLV